MSTLLAFFWGSWFSQERLLSKNSAGKASNILKSAIYTNTPCKSTCLYNASTLHIVEMILFGALPFFCSVPISVRMPLVAYHEALSYSRRAHVLTCVLRVAAAAEAAISALDVDAVECHAEGRLMRDAVEVLYSDFGIFGKLLPFTKRGKWLIPSLPWQARGLSMQSGKLINQKCRMELCWDSCRGCKGHTFGVCNLLLLFWLMIYQGLSLWNTYWII